MKGTLTVTGIGFLVLIVGAYFLFERKNENIISNTSSPSAMEIMSSAFAHNASIPSKYTCDGGNTSPPLSIRNTPANAKSLALIVTDPDIPEPVKQSMNIDMFDHWVLFNIPPTTTEIPEGVEALGTPGNNSRGQAVYTGPCPPPQYEPAEHRYFFKIYALDRELSLPLGASRTEVEEAMRGHVLDQEELVGRYKRIQ